MIDAKEQYFNNLMSMYNMSGYASLSNYDKYHIILFILDKMTYGFRKYLGNFVQELELPKFIHDKFPIMGMDNKNNYYVPKLYDLCVSKIKNDNININNPYYNKLLKDTNIEYKVDDYNYKVLDYFLNVYYYDSEYIISFLINYYNYMDYTNRVMTSYSESESESDSDSEIDYPDEEDSDEEDSEYDY